MKRFLGLLAILSAAAVAQSVEFLQITDTHVMKIDGIHPDLVIQRQANVLSAKQLESSLEKLKTNPPDFILHTGDILEAFRYDDASGGVLNGQIGRFQSITRLSPAPMYLTLGNRDVSWYRAIDGKQVSVRDQATTAEARAAWRSSFDCFRGGTWYSFEKSAGRAKYLFAVLDNGDTTDQALMQKQLAWLRTLLASSRHAALILAAHIPLPENPFGRSVLEILAGYNRPVLVLAGHRHTDGLEEISDVPKKTQVRTASFTGGKMNTRRVVLTPGGIDVYVTSEPGNLLLTVPAQAN